MLSYAFASGLTGEALVVIPDNNDFTHHVGWERQPGIARHLFSWGMFRQAMVVPSA